MVASVGELSSSSQGNNGLVAWIRMMKSCKERVCRKTRNCRPRNSNTGVKIRKNDVWNGENSLAAQHSRGMPISQTRCKRYKSYAIEKHASGSKRCYTH